MRKLVTPDQMRICESDYMKNTGVSSLELVSRAAKETVDVIIDIYGTDKTVYFACGSGGNGADGYMAAKLYAEKGGLSFAITALPPMTGDCRRAMTMAEEAGATVTDDWRSLPEPDLWVDAIFGIGLSRAPEGEPAEIITRMNTDGSDTLAVDIPSGLNGLSGVSFDTCVSADITVTFHRAKTGHYLNDALDVCGEVVVHSIGIPDSFLPENAVKLVNFSDVRVRPRLRNTHKGDYGKLLIIAGSLGMAGAAAICANAAMRSGAGLTTVACPSAIIPIIQTLAPCATCIPLDDESYENISGVIKGFTAVAIGCGLTTKRNPDIVKAVLLSRLPCVIDADALNIISENDALKEYLHDNCVITPHPGEAGRLLKRGMTNPIADARELSGMGVCAVLKGASSVISSQEGMYISPSGCAGMAKGGSGDALTGMIGAFLAQGMSPTMAAYAASELHGLAGEAAQEELGDASMLATDLIDMIPDVLR